MKHKILLVLMAFVVSMVVTFAQEPYKIGQFDLGSYVFKQKKPDGKSVLFIPAGIINGFLAVEQEELPQFLALLKSMQEIYNTHEATKYDTGGKSEKVNIAIPSFGGMVGETEVENLSYEKISPLVNSYSTVSINSNDNIYNCRRIQLSFRTDPNSSNIRGYLSFNDESNIGALIDIVQEEIDINTPGSGIKAFPGERLGKWKKKHEIIRHKTKDNTRYYIQTGNNGRYNDGVWDSYLWFNESELDNMISMMTSLKEAFDEYKKNKKANNFKKGALWIELYLQDIPRFEGYIVGRLGNTLNISGSNSHAFNGKIRAWYQPIEGSDPCMRLEIYYDKNMPDGDVSEHEEIECLYEDDLNGLLNALKKIKQTPNNSSVVIQQSKTSKENVNKPQGFSQKPQFEPVRELDITELAFRPFGCIKCDENLLWQLKEDHVKELLNEAVLKSYLKQAYDEKYGCANFDIDDSFDPASFPSDAQLYLNSIPVISVGYRFNDNGNLDYLSYKLPMFIREKPKWNQGTTFNKEDIAAVIYPLIEKMQSAPGWEERPLKEAHDKFKTTYVTDEEGTCFVNTQINTAMVITWDLSASVYLTSLNNNQ